MTTPLAGIRVVEMAGLAPAPFAGMILADFGADVIRIDRPGNFNGDQLCRHKRSIALNLKDRDGRKVFHSLTKKADVLIEPFRPGVMERLGFGPDELCRENPGLIYARMTGFRRDGTYKDMAGHDINYIAVSGVLSLLGRQGEKPHAPGNLLGDFAGGGLMCAMGILLALLGRQRSNRGQVVEANMVDGAAYIATFARLASKTPMWGRKRGTNLLDGGAPFYDTYQTKDQQYVAVGALEPQFYAALLKGLGLEREQMPDRDDHSRWDELRLIFTERFRSKSLREWQQVFNGTDACVTAVEGIKDLEQRAPVNLSSTPAVMSDDEASNLTPGCHSKEILEGWLGWSKANYMIGNNSETNASKSNL